jgi:hemerythrin
MPFMTWTEKMSVSVAILDDDHKKLFTKINELFDAINAGEGKTAVTKTLQALVAYTAEHFKREEQVMIKAGYPELEAHKSEHAQLIQQTLELLQKCKNGPTGALPLEVLGFLKKWLTAHVQSSDKKYALYISSKGIK